MTEFKEEKAMSDCIFGYFDSAEQGEPIYDPGLHVPCPCCLLPVGDRNGVTTISLLAEKDTWSFFFRAHTGCWQQASAKEKTAIESSLIDSRNTGG